MAPFASARTLPAEAYTSRDVFGWELAHFFEETWVCVGRAHDVSTASVRCVEAGAETVLLSRDEVGELRAFFNVCRHRAHELLAAGEVASSLICPYHGWSYRKDGSLRAAPRFGGSIHEAEFGLTPVDVTVWEGWIFVNVSRSAPPLAEHLGHLTDLVAAHQPGGLDVAARLVYEVRANWKLLCENYHECYHCPGIHPELCVVSPPDSGHNLEPDGAWIGGTMDLREGMATMSLDGTSNVPPLEGLSDEMKRKVGYFGLFPNLLISLHPDYVMTHRLEPVAPDRTRIICEFLFTTREGLDPTYATEFWDLVNRQDWKACEAVQRGTESRGHRPGPLGPNEDAVYQFLNIVARSYTAGRLVVPR